MVHHLFPVAGLVLVWQLTIGLDLAFSLPNTGQYTPTQSDYLVDDNTLYNNDHHPYVHNPIDQEIWPRGSGMVNNDIQQSPLVSTYWPPYTNPKDAYPWLDKLSQSVIPNTMGNEQQEQQWQQQHEYNEPLFNSDIHLSIPDESKASAALVDGAYGPKNANQPPLKPQVVGTKSKPGTRSTPEVTMSPNLGISSNFRVSMSPQLRTSSKSKFTMSLKQSLALCEIYSKWAFPSGQGLGQGSSAVHNRPLNSAPPCKVCSIRGCVGQRMVDS
ncbi:hypothetical protein BJ085DRAFT_31093 [Dimargaris cristalligena]|uniref:Uncharacterized protein n=1 Tax=Dimargaris cristalligena TaxID=215637 RepID=A0A4P9ZXE7_9FUNG|nr:hypothetical protein BJ085DRAFT_31093 [Dimargaris cristalligena]|eukprot:RKP37380.1 hypothetical protein BJ085DRAFT_31093 [Dimargaris cristalligena]